MADHVVGGLHCAEVEDLAASFVLGALETAEGAAVRAHLAGCPEPHPEFAELGSVVPALFEAVEPMEPDPSLKGWILAAAADTQREHVPAADTQSERMSAADTQRRAGGGFFDNLFRRPVWSGVAMAAVVAAVALGAWNLALRSDIDGLTAYRNGVTAVLEQARQPGAQLAVLSAGSTGGPSGFAAVGSDGTVTLVMHELAPTAGAQVYEAWLIAGQNAPVPIGGFTVSGNGTASFAVAHASLGEGVTVALTLEPGPNATTPTLPIVAAGAARTAS